jgi:hypothetical protein
VRLDTIQDALERALSLLTSYELLVADQRQQILRLRVQRDELVNVRAMHEELRAAVTLLHIATQTIRDAA